MDETVGERENVCSGDYVRDSVLGRVYETKHVRVCVHMCISVHELE